MIISSLSADSVYVPYHTSHVRVHRDKNNQTYHVELPVESYAIDDPDLSVPPVIIPPKPVTYSQDEPELDIEYEPELVVPNI